MENNENKIENETDEMYKKVERFGKKLALAAGLGSTGYVLYKTIIKPRIDKKRRTQDELIQIVKQLLLESIERLEKIDEK